MVYKSNFCVIDTETTGLLNESKSEVIEIACLALKASDLSEMGRYESLVQPQNIDLSQPLPGWCRKAFEVNKIPPNALAEAPTGEEVCNKLIGIFKELKKPILVGHNVIGFDIPMLQRLFQSCGQNLFDYIFSPTIDTYTLSYVLWCGDSSMPNVKLGTVAQKLEVKVVDAHRAMADVEANADVFRKLLNGFASMGSKIANGKVTQPERKSSKGGQYKCPECGKSLVLRVAKKGRNAGKEFYGCSGFTDGCRFGCPVNVVFKYKK